ncbi:hypothetical protein [Hymenobacter koreensis]|uniref:Uncharacterized protein n=1 Tax=Hymenobacter koreensis TaxID=1084523 RepID=A0ABP8JJN5_9BACT
MTRYSNVVETIDRDTGEVTKVKNTFRIKARNEPFCMILTQHTDALYRITRGRDFHVLLVLAELCEYNTGKVFLPADRRQQVLQKLGMKSQHFSNSITRLRSLGLVTGTGGDLELDARSLWKGTTDGRDAKLKK